MLSINTNPFPTYMSYIKPPCLNCRMRDIGCHSVCILYEDYKYDLNVLKTKARESNDNKIGSRSYDYYKWRNSYCNGRKINQYYK